MPVTFQNATKDKAQATRSGPYTVPSVTLNKMKSINSSVNTYLLCPKASLINNFIYFYPQIILTLQMKRYLCNIK
jgi:hypothetical protein